MFGRSTKAVKGHAATVSELATMLARDKRFRRQLLGAAKHGSRAKRRAVHHIGALSVAGRLAADAQLRDEVQQMTRDLQAAWNTLQTKRRKRHMLRSTLVLAGAGAAVAVALRKRGTSLPGVGDGTSPRTIEASIEVDVPVSTAYNQWTQFEEFPQFMQGVEEVHQLDDTRLHWVASVGGASGRVGREDPRAAPRPAGQLDQRGRQEDPRHRHVRAARRGSDARPPVPRLPGRGLRRGSRLGSGFRPPPDRRRSRAVQGADRRSPRRDRRVARRHLGGDDDLAR